ncbi:hypothetical protein L7F22_069321 [Adiantum nelumboides]|nr:hypothetical protein [Adiantum nelumboides]
MPRRQGAKREKTSTPLKERRRHPGRRKQVQENIEAGRQGLEAERMLKEQEEIEQVTPVVEEEEHGTSKKRKNHLHQISPSRMSTKAFGAHIPFIEILYDAVSLEAEDKVRDGRSMNDEALMEAIWSMRSLKGPDKLISMMIVNATSDDYSDNKMCQAALYRCKWAVKNVEKVVINDGEIVMVAMHTPSRESYIEASLGMQDIHGTYEDGLLYLPREIYLPWFQW